MKFKDLVPFRLKQTIVTAVQAWSGRAVALTSGAFWKDWFGSHNFTGQSVSVSSALQLSTVWACVRLIAETLSTLPMNVYVERAGKKTLAYNHTMYTLLHTQPNFTTTAVVFWQAFITSLLLWGGAHVEKKMSGEYITSLMFLPAELIWRDQDGKWWYADPAMTEPRHIPDDNMWYTPAFTVDGQTGLSPIQVGANVMGGAMAADRASADTFKNGMKASGLVTMDQQLTKDQRGIVRGHVQDVAEKGGYFVLEKGTGFQQLNMNPQDAELLQTRAFNVEEICRWFRVPPFMVGHSEKSTSWGTGIEQQMIAFVTFVLRPWAVRIEQSARMNLFTATERNKYSAEFALEGLLRGDSASRGAFYSVMTQNGIYTRDECRLKENLEEMGGNAAVLTVQSNLVPIDKLGQQAPAPAAVAAPGGSEENAPKNVSEVILQAFGGR